MRRATGSAAPYQLTHPAMESRTSVIDLYKLPRQQLAEHGVTPITSISELWMSPLFTKYAESIAGVPVDLKTVAAKLPKDFPRLDAPAIDVLAYVVSLWLERHQATGEASSTIKFASVDAIRTMGWSYDGPSKKRFERALKKLAPEQRLAVIRRDSRISGARALLCFLGTLASLGRAPYCDSRGLPRPKP